MSGSSPYAVLGTREFSRVRKFDMEERRRRILGNSKYDIAVDKEALDKQVKDEIEYRTKQEKAKEQFEKWEIKKIESMKKAEEVLEAEKKICNQEYEQYWQEQRKCRVQREVDEKMHLLSVNDRIGPFDKLRYDDQEFEPQKSTAIQLSVNHTRLWQEQQAMEKKQQESKERIDWIQKDIQNRKQLRLMEENIKGQLFERDKKIEREMVVRSQEKHKEAQLEHLKNHMYQISPEYFDQFQTTAR